MEVNDAGFGKNCFGNVLSGMCLDMQSNHIIKTLNVNRTFICLFVRMKW